MWKHLKRLSGLAAAIFLTCACVGCSSRLALGAMASIAGEPMAHSHPIAQPVP